MRIRSKTRTGGRRNQYAVSVFYADDAIEFPASDRLSIPLTRLFGGTVFAENERMAAARVWIDKVGRYRDRRLANMGAPAVIREAGVDPEWIVNELVPSSLCPVDGGYLLDNRLEVWLISVRKVS